jgi:hypothetical protein
MTCAPTCKARRLAERHAAWREERAKQRLDEALLVHLAKRNAEEAVFIAIAVARGGRPAPQLWNKPGTWMVMP